MSNNSRSQEIETDRFDREYCQKRFAEVVKEVRENHQPPNLLTFLRVLLWHHVVVRAIAEEQTTQGLAAWEAKLAALAEILDQLDKNGSPFLPHILEDYDMTALREAACNYRAEVDAANLENIKSNPNRPRIKPVWHELAFRLAAQKHPANEVDEVPGTPWEYVTEKLIGKCTVTGIGTNFLKNWVAAKAGALKSGKKSAELARLAAKNVQVELLSVMRERFPKEAEDWFGAIPIGLEAPSDKGMSWREAADRMTNLKSRGELWTSQQKMAEQIGCSSGTINKAIHNTPELLVWAKPPLTSPKAQDLNEIVTDRTAQNREPDPEDDAAVREFLESADSETKAWFMGLSTEDQLNFLNDSDSNPKILGRKP